MNKTNVRAIKVKTKQEKSRTLLYEVVFLQRINDLRSNVDDRRFMLKGLLGDGWRSGLKEVLKREVLNDNVDEFLETLDRNGFEYTKLYEKDLETLEF